MKDENGKSCNIPELQQQRWRRHYSNVLNLQSEFYVEELERVRQRPMRPEMGDPPSAEKLQNALGNLKCGKASGETGILPEMLKVACSTEECMKQLLELVSVRLALATLLSYTFLAEWSPQVPHKKNNCNLALLCSTASKSLLNTKLSLKSDLNCVHEDKL